MNLFRNLLRLAAPALATLMTSLPAAAVPGTDYTDLWYKPNESGWGVNIVQQADVAFATLFVYGADNTARWYVASDLRGGTNSFTGTLYQTTGPAFSATWTTGGAPPVAVGSMSLAFNGPNDGTLTYTVNGVSVSKQIQRQTFRSRDLSGNYLGGLAALGSGCIGGFTAQVLTTGYLRVAQAGTEITLVVDFYRGDIQGRCTYAGDFTPAGRLGTITGVHTCRVGAIASSGPFTMTEVDAGKTVFGAVYTARDEVCTSYSGFFGGVRDIQLPPQ